MKKIISGLCAVLSALALLSFSSCEKPLIKEDKVGVYSSLKAQIVVDEETLVQYIFYGDVAGLRTDSRVASLTVRLKEDGTPYTINREDLDKYTHFSFNNKEREI